VASTVTDTTPEIQDKVPNTLLEDSEDEKSGTDMTSRTEPSSEVSDNETHVSSDQKVEDDTKKEPAPPAATGPKTHPPLPKTYGTQWNWDPDTKDYIQKRGSYFHNPLDPRTTLTTSQEGKTIRYRDYQRTGAKVPPAALSPLPTGPSPQPTLTAQSSEPPPPSDLPQEQDSLLVAEKDPEKEVDEDWVKLNLIKRGLISSERSVALGPDFSPKHPPAPPPPKPHKEYIEPLDQGTSTAPKSHHLSIYYIPSF